MGVYWALRSLEFEDASLFDGRVNVDLDWFFEGDFLAEDVSGIVAPAEA